MMAMIELGEGRRVSGAYKFGVVTISILLALSICLFPEKARQRSQSRSLSTALSLSPSEIEKLIQKDFELAAKQSFNMFNNIRSADWKRIQKRVKSRRNHFHETNPTYNRHIPRQWYMLNFDPDFTCPHERRISAHGGRGDGGKWVCDPHRIAAQAKIRQGNHKNGCLIYSIGSEGDFMFENAIQEAIEHDEPCEIHVFDVDNYKGVAPRHVHFHHWGLKSSKDTHPHPNVPLKSLQETLKILGHEGAVIDIFKIDCEGCEWTTYHDWVNADVRLNQILVEVHQVPPEAIGFFTTLQNEGYVTFHKENNLIGDGSCVEYAFLKLARAFFK